MVVPRAGSNFISKYTFEPSIGRSGLKYQWGNVSSGVAAH